MRRKGGKRIELNDLDSILKILHQLQTWPWKQFPPFHPLFSFAQSIKVGGQAASNQFIVPVPRQPVSKGPVIRPIERDPPLRRRPRKVTKAWSRFISYNRGGNAPENNPFNLTVIVFTRRAIKTSR